MLLLAMLFAMLSMPCRCHTPLMPLRLIYAAALIATSSLIRFTFADAYFLSAFAASLSFAEADAAFSPSLFSPCFF